MDKNLIDYIEKIPKAELHVHIEGTLEPELMFQLAQRNKVPLIYQSVEDVKKAYEFNNLQEFLDLYYQAAEVLLTQQDFYDLTMAYLQRAHADNVVHTEMFFDPQTHTDRGVAFETVINGIVGAQEEAKNTLGISSKLIMCFLRHLSEESAFETLEMALPYKDKITAIGLDSSEVGNPPSKFFNVFNAAKEEGFRVVAHAGEEASHEYVREALDLLEVMRIDHGVQSVADEVLMEDLMENEIPLTVCPLSNLKLKVFESLEELPVKTFLDKNILVTINSDDPAYFGGYINENYIQTAHALGLTQKDVMKLARNSIIASFISGADKQKYLQLIQAFDDARS